MPAGSGAVGGSGGYNPGTAPGMGGWGDSNVPGLKRSPSWYSPQNPPDGYQYDPISGTFNRSPQSAGGRAGDYVSAFDKAAGIPSITGLMSGTMSGGTGSGGAMGTAGAGTGGASSGGVGGGPGTGQGGYVGPIAPPDTRAATNAAYAQAKDQVGAQSRASIQALNGELGATGQMGSGAQVQGTEDIIKNAAGQLGAESNQELQTNAQLGEQNQLAGYQGNIAQRGQDIQHEEAQAQLALQANNAAAQRNLQLLTLALGGLSSANASGAGYGPIVPPSSSNVY